MRPRLLYHAVAALVSAATANAATAGAQVLPGRDLLRLPLGSMDRPAALGNDVADGLGNPASIVLSVGERGRVGVAALQTPADQGVTAHLLAAAVALPRDLFAGLSVARISVRDILRTETDPQTIGDAVAYSTMLYSATLARRSGRTVAAGASVRYRRGELDGIHRGAVGLDAGVQAQHLAFRDASIGAASFLWRPGSPSGDRAALNLAADLRVAGRGELSQLRAGFAATLGDARYREYFGFLAAKYGVWEGRAGVARTDAFGGRSWRGRLGLVLHFAQYAVGIAREENAAGLAASYQFTLKSSFR